MNITQKQFPWKPIILFSIPILILAFFFINLTLLAGEIVDIEFIGQAIVPNSKNFQNTPVGGLSGITYDAKNDLYYVISDDRSQKAPGRFYTFKIDLSKGFLQQNGAVPVGVTLLLNDKNQNFGRGTIDSEGIALTNRSSVFISSEGNAAQLINPFIKEFSLASGKEINMLPVPQKFLPTANGKRGIRNNLAFENLTITPNQKHLFSATENALIQDGTAAKPGVRTNCRILQYNLTTNQLEKEYLYQTEAIKPSFNITGKYAQGLPDLHALDNQGHFLSIERAFTGLGFAISLFQVSLKGASDIHNIDSLLTADTKAIQPVQKKLLLDLRKLDVLLDNIEALTLGGKLPNGQSSLIVVSDNNFQPIQRTQFLAFKLKHQSLLQQYFSAIKHKNAYCKYKNQCIH